MSTHADVQGSSDGGALVNLQDLHAALDAVAGQSETHPANPQAHGWNEPTPLDYAALSAAPAATIEGETATTADAPTWAHNAARYEWDDEYGDVGPEFPELERELFRRDTISTIGHELGALHDFQVTQEGPARVQHIRHFKDAGLHPVMENNVRLAGFAEPTPIQSFALPAILSGSDLIGVAQTGSGKTAAYLIPVLSRLMGKAKQLAAPRPNPKTFNPATEKVRAEPLVLIICPTRELAMQIFDEARKLCYRSMLRPCLAYGGAPRRSQLEDLQKGCDILIGVPGRLKDFVTTEPGTLSLRRVKYTIIDEADEMLDGTWEDQLGVLLPGGAGQDEGDHQILLFSATFKKEARDLARMYLSDDHVRIRVGRAGSTHANISQSVVWVEREQKNKALYDLLIALPKVRTLVFVNHLKTVDEVDDFLYNNGFPSTSIHSQRSQQDRESAIRGFRHGKTPILVTTGVAARGLDIYGVMHVINFDLPDANHGGIQEYVHRIGRTARIGNKGQATSFYNERDESLAQDLVNLLIESKQDVPDFLIHLTPEGDLKFEDDTDNEGEEETTGGSKGDAGAGWGDANAAAAWGSANAAAAGGVSVETEPAGGW